MHEFFMFLAGAALGGLLSWLITHRYYVKAGQEQKLELDRLAEKLRSKNTLSDFEDKLISSEWSMEMINDVAVWVAKDDNTFQISRGARTQDFQERWTKVHPDNNSASYPVYLSINNNTIKELTFVAVDGGRIFVPIPEIRPVEVNDVEYFWNMNSLEIKVCDVVGSYYIYESIAGVAKRSKITLID
ncbi:MAG: hypothetical protein ACT6RZ_08915 [Methylophilus sp.]|uniref:hypothetical protein n=1 Tax=Methylophilus sp. TaxID=29541 RepID=UPI0040357B95